MNRQTLFIKIGKKILKGMVVAILFLTVLFTSLVAYLFVAYHQPLLLPSPTGAYQIGKTEYDWIDSNRNDSLSDKTDQKRELLIWVWYPVSAAITGPKAPYLPPAWVQAHNEDQGIGQYLEYEFASIQTYSFQNAPVASTQPLFPVIIMQPGMGPAIPDYTVLAENLASHGYIVVGINPTYTSNLIVLPDGRVVTRSKSGTIPDSADAAAADADANRIGEVWAEDVIFTMDQLEHMNANPGDRFYNRLDLAHLGIFGHSFGGATALSVCKMDARCKTGADLDGTVFSHQAEGTLQLPFMFMTEDSCGENCDTMHQEFDRSKNEAYYLAIKGTKHFNFSDLPLRLLLPARVFFEMAGYIGPIRPERGLEIANVYLVAFFDQYLKGINSELMQTPSDLYPEVKFEKR